MVTSFFLSFFLSFLFWLVCYKYTFHGLCFHSSWPVGKPAIQKRRDREGNVSLPTLGLVAARCIFSGIIYCLADSMFGVSHGSVSQVKTACIQRSTYIFCQCALRFMLITFL